MVSRPSLIKGLFQNKARICKSQIRVYIKMILLAKGIFVITGVTKVSLIQPGEYKRK